MEIFALCLRNDSFKIGMQIYFRQIKVADMTETMLNILLNSIRTSVVFHEIKLFLVHQHFDQFTIAQLNELVDIYQSVLDLN